MAKLILSCLVVVAVAAFVAAEEKYTSKYDNINIDEVLSNKRLLTNYFKCIIDEGKCTNDGAELKANIPDALTNECKKCTEKQKEVSEKVVRYLIKNEADMWKQLKEKYDPEGIYEKRYKSEAEKHGIQI